MPPSMPPARLAMLAGVISATGSTTAHYAQRRDELPIQLMPCYRGSIIIWLQAMQRITTPFIEHVLGLYL